MLLLATLPVALAAPIPRPGLSADVTPTDLRVNYLDQPLAIDDPAPTFSWKLQADDGVRGASASCTLSVKADGMLEAAVG
eukprot:COSAG06_NODE_5778_length_3278_cov_2.766279_1_plen_80_part_00